MDGCRGKKPRLPDCPINHLVNERSSRQLLYLKTITLLIKRMIYRFILLLLLLRSLHMAVCEEEKDCRPKCRLSTEEPNEDVTSPRQAMHVDAAPAPWPVSEKSGGCCWNHRAGWLMEASSSSPSPTHFEIHLLTWSSTLENFGGVYQINGQFPGPSS